MAYRDDVAAVAVTMRKKIDPNETSVSKLPQVQVGYRPSRSCEGCHFYLPSDIEDSGQCQIVSGAIDGDWICDRYQSKSTPSSDFMLASW